jgi:RNA polymerase sigma factor (TIGR02999 family)
MQPTTYAPKSWASERAPITDHVTAQSASVTELLNRARSGDSSALENVFPLIYGELHDLAERQLRHERDGHTLSPTALVHEAYMRLVDYTRMEWTGRVHFMAVASTAMRRVLVDHARGRQSLKRGGGRRRVSLDSIQLGMDEQVDLLIAVDTALERLAEHDARQARVVECRFFGGMTEEDTAEALGIGLRTVKRDWARAKSWLYRELSDEPSPGLWSAA